MNFTINTKTTDQFTEEDWHEYVNMFSEVFHVNYTKEQLEHKYKSSYWGYSIHSLLYADGVMVGGYSGIVELLEYKGTPRLFVCGCDAMIREQYRTKLDSMALLHKALITYFSNKDIVGIIGETHQQLLTYLSFTCNFKLIGYVSNWIIPINFIPGFLGTLFNPLWRLFIIIFLKIATINTSKLYTEKEVFKPLGDYTPSEYHCQKKTFSDGKYVYYYVSSKKHLVIIYHNCLTIKELYSSIQKILKESSYMFRAVEFRTAGKLVWPFICYKQKQIFHGFLIDKKVEENEYFNITNWRYMRGYFD